eukprot:gene12430-15629_t
MSSADSITREAAQSSQQLKNEGPADKDKPGFWSVSSLTGFLGSSKESQDQSPDTEGSDPSKTIQLLGDPDTALNHVRATIPPGILIAVLLSRTLYRRVLQPLIGRSDTASNLIAVELEVDESSTCATPVRLKLSPSLKQDCNSSKFTHNQGSSAKVAASAELSPSIKDFETTEKLVHVDLNVDESSSCITASGLELSPSLGYASASTSTIQEKDSSVEVAASVENITHEQSSRAAAAAVQKTAKVAAFAKSVPDQARAHGSGIDATASSSGEARVGLDSSSVLPAFDSEASVSGYALADDETQDKTAPATPSCIRRVIILSSKLIKPAAVIGAVGLAWYIGHQVWKPHKRGPRKGGKVRDLAEVQRIVQEKALAEKLSAERAAAEKASLEIAAQEFLICQAEVEEAQTLVKAAKELAAEEKAYREEAERIMVDAQKAMRRYQRKERSASLKAAKQKAARERASTQLDVMTVTQRKTLSPSPAVAAAVKGDDKASPPKIEDRPVTSKSDADDV